MELMIPGIKRPRREIDKDQTVNSESLQVRGVMLKPNKSFSKYLSIVCASVRARSGDV
jgi:hypothetical protein